MLFRLHTLRIPWIAMCFVVLATGWVAAESASLYLRVRVAPVRSKPSFKEGGQEGLLLAGQRVEVLERSKEGEWVKVRYARFESAKPGSKAETLDEKGHKDGWVHATMLAGQPPPEPGAKAPWIERGGAVFEQAGKGAPPAVSTVYAQSRKADPRVLEALEKLYPSAEELDRFLHEGRLGVYRDDWPALEGGVAK